MRLGQSVSCHCDVEDEGMCGEEWVGEDGGWEREGETRDGKGGATGSF